MSDGSDSDVDTKFPQIGVLPSTLFIRKFYPDLLNNLLMNKPWDFQIMVSVVHPLPHAKAGK